ncbi:MAG: CPBP family intramembrane metalloprotease [Clostridia bacterium]|nr:CPBP family intramembrane metalloprotease [Clostridia bacterium]
MKITKRHWVIILAGLIGCGAMALVDGLWQPGYWVKSAVKMVLFLALPVAAAALGARDALRALPKLFRPDRRALIRAVGLGLGVLAVILGGYFTLGQFFDLTAITGALTSGVGVTGDNFLFVSIYISFVNSLLEEFFFRGFLFLGLLDGAPRWVAHVLSAGLFALYHIAMMLGWGSPALILLILAALFVGGWIFNRLNEASRCIWPSWLVHLCANLAINTIGFILFAAA